MSAAPPAEFRTTRPAAPDDPPRATRQKEKAPQVDLYEYQGKQYFARFGIPTSPGGVADTVDEAVVQADDAGYPVVVKAQVKVGGRGKAGGVKLAARRRRGPPPRRQHPRARHQRPRRQATLGRARLRHRRRSTTPASPWTAPTSCTSACCRPRAGSRSRRWRSPIPTPSPCCTSTPWTASTRRRHASGSTGPTSTPRPASRPPRCWCASTTATSRVTATWPRSTR